MQDGNENNYAPVTDRALATFLDYGFIYSVTHLSLIFLGKKHSAGVYVLDGWPVLMLFIVWWIYFPVVEGIFKATLGHWIFNMKVSRVNGNPVDIVAAIKRHLLDPLDLFFFGVPAIISISNTVHRQRLGDLWAGTVVLKTENN